MTVLAFRKRRIRRYRKRLPKHKGMRSKSYIPKRIYTVTKGKTQIFKVRQERVKLFSWKPIDPLQYGRSFNLTRGMGKAAGRWRFKPEVKKKPRAFRYPKGKKSFESPIDFGSKAWKKYAFKYTQDFKYREPLLGYGKGGKAIHHFSEHASGHSWKGLFLYGRTGWGGSKKGKKFPSPSGRGGFWGPKGTFTPALIWDIRLNRSEFRSYMSRYMKESGIKMSEGAIRIDIHKAMKVARRKFLQKTSRYIDTYVPKDTGTLRRTMKISLYKQPLRALVSRIIMDTGDLQYAKPVNRMSSTTLQHDAFKKPVKSRGWYKNSKLVINRQNHPGFNYIGRVKQIQDRVSIKQAYKHDPKAQKNWWYLSVMSARAFAKQAYKDFIEVVKTMLTIRLYADFAKTYRKYPSIAKMFKVDYDTQQFNKLMDREFVKETPNGLLRTRQNDINFIEYDKQGDYNSYKAVFDEIISTRYMDNILVKIDKKRIYIPGTKPFTMKQKRAQAKKYLEEHPGIAADFPHWISSFMAAKEAPFYLGSTFSKQQADFKIQEGKERTENSIEDEERIKSRRRANLRDRWSSAMIKNMISPTKTDIEKLFKVKFK